MTVWSDVFDQAPDDTLARDQLAIFVDMATDVEYPQEAIRDALDAEAIVETDEGIGVIEPSSTAGLVDDVDEKETKRAPTLKIDEWFCYCPSCGQMSEEIYRCTNDCGADLTDSSAKPVRIPGGI